MKKIIRGETHCDTIGDIFKNNFLIDIINDWYEIKKNRGKLKVWKDEKKKIFSPDFYDLIRETFDERGKMEDFLVHLREYLLTNETLYSEIQDRYSNDDLVNILLAFDELNKQLALSARLTIQGIFSEKIINILKQSFAKGVFSDNGDEQLFPNITVAHGLDEALEKMIIPISNVGKILCRVSGEKDVHIVVVLGTDNILKVNRFGVPIETESKNSSLLGSREDVLIKIGIYERMIKYHNDTTGSYKLSKYEQDFYEQKCTRYISGKRFLDKEVHEKVSVFLQLELKILIDGLKKTPLTDKSKIIEWTENGIQPGITTKLPSGTNVQQFIPKKTTFKVVK